VAGHIFQARPVWVYTQSNITNIKCINISDVTIEKIFDILGIQLSADIILMVYSLYRARKERDSVVFKYINISDMNIDKIFCMAFTKKITWETKENLLTCHSSLFKQERQGDSQCVITNHLAYQQALCNRRKRQGGSQCVPSRTNKGKFRFLPISAFVYVLALSQP
jgi:hypothetical protein